MARSMFNDKGPNDYWEKFVAVSIYTLNISHTKAARNIGQYEACFQRKPIVSHLKVFGCIN